jgi:hypothetical protein
LKRERLIAQAYGGILRAMPEKPRPLLGLISLPARHPVFFASCAFLAVHNPELAHESTKARKVERPEIPIMHKTDGDRRFVRASVRNDPRTT